jgi:hypothetical protein
VSCPKEGSNGGEMMRDVTSQPASQSVGRGASSGASRWGCQALVWLGSGRLRGGVARMGWGSRVCMF